MNGMPTRGFTFTMDGVDASSDAEFPSLGLYQNFNFIKGTTLEAVKEVEVSKNIFSAEIGMTVSGNVNIITKSGTNQLHGSTFWNYQSGGLNARDHLTALKVSSLGVAIPLMVCVLISILSFLKWIREDKPHLEKGTLPEESD